MFQRDRALEGASFTGIDLTTVQAQFQMTCMTGSCVRTHECLHCLQISKNFSPFDRVSVLSEALPYLQQFRNKTIVIKYGGAAMKDPVLKVSICNLAFFLCSCFTLSWVSVHFMPVGRCHKRPCVAGLCRRKARACTWWRSRDQHMA